MAAGTYLIIGAGQAAAWAMRTLRGAGADERIILIGAEPHLPYERPPLSKEVLMGDAAAASQRLLHQDELDALDVAFLPQTTVTHIDRVARRVTCADGRTFDYTRLLLATGGTPVLPPIPGIDLPGVHVLRSLDDALALRDALADRPRVAVIGGGWIGLETAAAARAQGCVVTVLEAAARLCGRSVMPQVSDALAALHTDAGVALHLNTCVRSLHALGTGTTLRLSLSGGTSLDADCVVIGTGMRASDALASAAGLACKQQGVLVDAQCRSSDPNIYAAGDVTVRWDARMQAFLRLESWQNAQDQGVAAAQAMLGQVVNYQPLPQGWSDQYDRRIQIVGYPNLVRQTHVRTTTGGGTLYLGADAEECISAVVGINAGRDFRQARRWVQDRAPMHSL